MNLVAGRTRAGGFTLIELIVVIGIFAVISVLAYGGLNSVLNTRKDVETSLERTANMQRAYVRLRNDFQQLRNRPVRDAYGTGFEPALWLTLDRRVEFTRGGWRNPLSHPRSTMERVSYRVDDDDRLVRESWRVLDRPPEAEPVRLPLVEGVRNAAWRFMDAQRQWHLEWPPSDQRGAAEPPTPRAIELTLDTRDWGEIRLLFAPEIAP